MQCYSGMLAIYIFLSIATAFGFPFDGKNDITPPSVSVKTSAGLSTCLSIGVKPILEYSCKQQREGGLFIAYVGLNYDHDQVTLRWEYPDYPRPYSDALIMITVYSEHHTDVSGDVYLIPKEHTMPVYPSDAYIISAVNSLGRGVYSHDGWDGWPGKGPSFSAGHSEHSVYLDGSRGLHSCPFVGNTDYLDAHSDDQGRVYDCELIGHACNHKMTWVTITKHAVDIEWDSTDDGETPVKINTKTRIHNETITAKTVCLVRICNPSWLYCCCVV